MPGGCNFGIRPIDQHLKGFSALGCDYSLDNGMIAVSAPRDLHGASVIWMWSLWGHHEHHAGRRQGPGPDYH